MVKQTAGRDTLGEFAPKFAQLNDDVLLRNMVKIRAKSGRIYSRMLPKQVWHHINPLVVSHINSTDRYYQVVK